MEAMASLWSSQEVVFDHGLCDTSHGFNELDSRLLFATLQLESARAEAEQKIRENEEKINQLLQLLQVTCQQRDEAWDQLKLLDTLAQPTTTTTTMTTDYLLDSSIPITTQLSSGSNLPALNCQSQSSSPELSSAEADPASAVIDRLAMARPLPEKGRLVEAMMNSAPLLKTLIVAGSLPRWRNPPPPQPVYAPPAMANDHNLIEDVSRSASNRNEYMDMHTGKRPAGSICVSNFASLGVKRQKAR